MVPPGGPGGGVIDSRRTGIGDFGARLDRLGKLGPETFGDELFTFLQTMFAHQVGVSARPATGAAAQRLAEGGFDLSRAAGDLADAIAEAASTLAPVAPGLLGNHALELLLDRERLALEIELWLAGGDLEVASLIWFQIGSAPLLEAIASISESIESNSSVVCPVCSAVPALAAIVEESGDFKQGAPRHLICSRCASWWRFPRAVCPGCGEHDPKQLSSMRAQEEWPWVRIDICLTCRRYLKTFDLREPGANQAVPQVDDVATLPLDLWAQDQAYHRMVPTLAGV